MKSLILLFSVLLLASCKNPKLEPAILLVGDSWLNLPCAMGTYDEVLTEFGHKSKRVECLLTTKSGTRVNDWLDPKNQEKVVKTLKNYPNLNVVILSIGGNDLLGEWNKNMSQEQTNAIYDRIEKKTEEILNYILSVRPEIKVVVTGYDYPNFNLLKPGVIKAYDELFERMGKPSPVELNHFLVDSTNRTGRMLNGRERVHYVSNLGLGQHIYGYAEYDIKPGDLLKPGNSDDPSFLIGGDPNLPQTPETLLSIEEFKVYDPYHLSKKGYKNIARNLMQTYIAPWIQ